MQILVVLVIIAVAFYLHSQKEKRDKATAEVVNGEKEQLITRIRSSAYYKEVYESINGRLDAVREVVAGRSFTKIKLIDPEQEPSVHRLGSDVRAMEEEEFAVFCELIAEILGEGWGFRATDENMTELTFLREDQVGLKDPF